MLVADVEENFVETPAGITNSTMLLQAIKEEQMWFYLPGEDTKAKSDLSVVLLHELAAPHDFLRRTLKQG